MGPLSLYVGYILQIMRCFYTLLLALAAVGLSKADLGEIDTFEVVSNTQDSITLEWTLTASDQAPIKYTLVEDSFISTDIQCTAPCQHTFEFMPPCSQHVFTVTPFYLVNGAPVSTNTASVNGSTQGAAPDAPTALVAVDHNHNVDLEWTPPADTACIDHWQVCYHGKGEVNDTCETTNLERLTIFGLPKCAEMIAEIRGVTPDEVYGKTLSSGFEMGYADPSDIRDLVVGKVTNSTVELKWNNPIDNPLCVERYSIDYGPIDLKVMNDDDDDETKTHDNHATISDLNGCTNYKFDVSPVTDTYQGNALSVTAETAESHPLDISNMEISYDKDSGIISVTWDPNPDDKCQFSWKICYHDEINPAENCFNDDGSQGESVDIPLQLEACTKYDVGVSGVSPSGMIGDFSWISIWTWDEQPSEVQNLAVESVDVNNIEISYDDPADNARCVHTYDVTIDDGLGFRATNSHHDDFFTELEACTDYEISVVAVTREGLRSPVATTQATTLEGPVSEPRSFGLHDNEKTETSISLVWYEPSTNKRCTGSYKLSWTGASDGSVDIVGGAYQTIYTVNELTCGEEYDFTLEVTSLSGGASTDSPVTYHEATLAC